MKLILPEGGHSRRATLSRGKNVYKGGQTAPAYGIHGKLSREALRRRMIKNARAKPGV